MSEAQRTEAGSLASIQRVMIVGCGRLGSAFAEALAGVGIEVMPVSARRRVSSAELARTLGIAPPWNTDLRE